MKITGFGPGNSLQIPGNYLEKFLNLFIARFRNRKIRVPSN
jgi:hypothetical protein